MRPKVLLVEPIGDPGMSIMREVGVVKILPRRSQRELVAHVRDADAVIIRAMLRIDSQVIDAGRRLKVIGRFGVGLDNVDVKKATERGIPVVWAPEGNYAAVADFSFGLIIAIARRIVSANHALKQYGSWERRHKLVETDVSEKVLGIIGFGRVGRAVAERARGFRMKVLVYDPFVEEKVISDLGGIPASLEELFSQSDFVSIHAPYTSETRKLIGDEEINMMKPRAFIINTARGGIVDSPALIKALRAKRIAGAALDTFEEEPPRRRNALFRLENVIATPHIAAFTQESLEKVSATVAEGVASALRNERPKYVFNESIYQNPQTSHKRARMITSPRGRWARE
jgi:D-3-phosphoglycerate dehydrogenase